MSILEFSEPYRAKEGEHPNLDADLYDTLNICRAVVDIFVDGGSAFFWRVKVSKKKRNGLDKWRDCETGYGDAGTALMDVFEFLGWKPPWKP